VALSSATFSPSQQPPANLNFSTSGQLSIHPEHLFAYYGPRKSPQQNSRTRQRSPRKPKPPRKFKHTPQKCLQPHPTAPPLRAILQTTPTISATRYTALSPAAQPIYRRADHAPHLQHPRQIPQRSAQVRLLQTPPALQTAHSAAKPSLCTAKTRHQPGCPHPTPPTPPTNGVRSREDSKDSKA